MSGNPCFLREIKRKFKSTVLGAGVGGESGEPPNPAVHMFYYAWYGNMQTDGRWWHWDHRY